MSGQANTNSEMTKLAEYASTTAKEKFGCILDFSEDSLAPLEALLDQAHQRFSQLAKDGKLLNESVQKTANVWGSYLGEVVRRKWGGTWSRKSSDATLEIDGCDIAPIAFVYQRITGQPQYKTLQYYADVTAKLKTRNQKPPLPSEWPVFSELPDGTSPVTTSAKSKTARLNSKWVPISAVVAIIVLSAVIVFALVSRSQANSIPQEFKTSVSKFLAEGEKLNVMTEQGVNIVDFRSQLVNVKTSYSLTGSTWPESVSSSKFTFDKAIQGWDLVLAVWNYKIDGNVSDYAFINNTPALIRKIKDYLGTGNDVIEFTDIKTLLGSLMTAASKYFDLGKQSVNLEL